MATNPQPVIDRLCKGCMPLAFSIINRFVRSHPRLREDLESDGLLALFRAAQAHDPARGAFTTLAHLAVTHACLNRLNRSRRRQSLNTISLDRARDDETGLVNTIAAKQPDVGADLENREQADQLLGRLNQISPRVRAVVELCAEGESLVAIAEAAAVSRARVGQLLARARDELRGVEA